MHVIYPLDPQKYTVIQGFGVDNIGDPISGNFYTLFDNKHPGVDFDVPVGIEIRASYAGIVCRREFHQGMGNVLGVRKGNLVALYAHLSEFKAKLGDIVLTGQVLGLSGNTGAACPEPHLHFEMRDISKSPLKNMVFDPPFEKECSNYSDTVIYKVNTHTKKSLGYLSKMYFGTESYWEKIRDKNELSYDKDEVLPQNQDVVIPNY